MIVKALLLLLLSVLTVAGCENNVSKVKHDQGRVLNYVMPGQWYDTSDEDFYEFVTNQDASLFLPREHPISVKIQKWMDHIHRVIGQSHRLVQTIPEPIARVSNVDELNAFVGTIDVCLDFSIKVKGGSAEEVDVLAFESATGTFRESFSCMNIQLSKSNQLQIIAAQFVAYPACSYEILNNQVTVSPLCFGEDRPKSGHRLVVTLMSNQIEFHLALVRDLTEHQLVSVAAHELGHYYLAHGISPSSLYGALYKLGEKNPGAKPVNNPEAEALGRRLLEIEPLENIAAVENQRYHSFVFHLAKILASEVCWERYCHESCKALATHMQSETTQEVYGDFPYEPLSAEGISQYREYERYATSCYSATALTDGDADYSVDIKRIKYAVEMVPSYARALGELPSAPTLDALFIQLGAELDTIKNERDREYNEILQEAVDYGLAIYTDEQEADEFAAEWLAEVGVDPREGVGANLVIAKSPYQEEVSYPGKITAEQCAALAANQWRDEKGNYVIVPVGDWNSAHHSPCFRAFNIDREITVHQLRVESERLPIDLGLPWSEIQAMATTILNE
jgi:hypothetical protein